MPRIDRRGRDLLTATPLTQWQAQRMHGPLQPMQRPRCAWWPFGRAGR